MLSEPARSIVSLFSFFAVGWQCTFPYSLFGQAKKKWDESKMQGLGSRGKETLFVPVFWQIVICNCVAMEA